MRVRMNTFVILALLHFLRIPSIIGKSVGNGRMACMPSPPCHNRHLDGAAQNTPRSSSAVDGLTRSIRSDQIRSALGHAAPRAMAVVIGSLGIGALLGRDR
jgi:hypothetical protein